MPQTLAQTWEQPLHPETSYPRELLATGDPQNIPLLGDSSHPLSRIALVGERNGEPVLTDPFSDEVFRTLTDELSVYEDYVAAVHKFGGEGIAVLNPGPIPDRGYFEFADAVVTFEDPFGAYLESREPPDWLRAETRSEVWHIVSDFRQTGSATCWTAPACTRQTKFTSSMTWSRTPTTRFRLTGQKSGMRSRNMAGC